MAAQCASFKKKSTMILVGNTGAEADVQRGFAQEVIRCADPGRARTLDAPAGLSFGRRSL
jgi:hypothetical protein